MQNRSALWFAFLAAIVAVLITATSQANPLTVVNHLTFPRAVGLPGVTLPAGTYTFERDANLNPNIVRVMTPNRQRMLYVGFSAKVTRPRGFDRIVAFGEAPAGEPIPIIAWYPIGSSEGHQFLYR